MTQQGNPGRRVERFLTTRWSVVQAAGEEDSPASREALARLCEAYWYPLYAFVRRSGHDAAAARDLTQGFFARLLEKRDLAAADPGRGRFRSFLLANLKFFLANERERQGALKRGGGRAPFSMDFEGADSRFGLEPAHGETPERAFERTWALALLERVLELVGREYARRGQGELFEALRPELTGAEPESRRALAERLSMTEGALKVALHRLRRRYGDALREAIAETVADPSEVDREIGALFEVLGPEKTGGAL